MRQKVFVPLTDEMLYDHPELITAPLRPFDTGQPCFHELANGMGGTGGTDTEAGRMTRGVRGVASVGPEISAPEKSVA